MTSGPEPADADSYVAKSPPTVAKADRLGHSRQAGCLFHWKRWSPTGGPPELLEKPGAIQTGATHVPALCTSNRNLVSRVASSLINSSEFGWPRLLATGVAQRHEVLTQSLGRCRIVPERPASTLCLGSTRTSCGCATPVASNRGHPNSGLRIPQRISNSRH
jgi:hypothetical protein